MSEPSNVEDAFQGLFSSASSGSGEEELLRIASQFALQITAPQIRVVLFLKDVALKRGGEVASRINAFVDEWLRIKSHNNSDIYIMKALEYVSLRKFLNEQSFKVDIQK